MSNNDDLTNLQRVQAVIQIKLIRNDQVISQIQSDVSEGSFPEFNSNHILELKSAIEDNFSIEEINNKKNRLVITLFDQLQSVRNGLEGRNKFIITVQKHFLGSLEVPILQLLNSSKMAGQFKVNRPLILFSYFNVK